VVPLIDRVGRFADLIKTESDCVSFVGALGGRGGASTRFG
jgi:hypothetical protein